MSSKKEEGTDLATQIPAVDIALSPRQWLSERQTVTVTALLDAARESLREVGFDRLTLRDVARRAGVTHTTAYTYFTSKEHVVAELHLQLIRALPTPEYDPFASAGTRLGDALRGASELYSADPMLSAAVLASMVTSGPDIERIRDAVGADIARRIGIALGPDVDPRIRDGIILCYSGATLQAGLGYSTFADVVTQMTEIADLWTSSKGQ